MRYSSAFIPIAILLISAMPLCLLLSIAYLPVHILEITYAEGGGRIFWRTINPGDRFSLSYTHSVQPSRVVNDFEIDQRHQMLLVSTTFSDHGAGLPDGLHYGETFSTKRDGRFRISGIHRFIPEILLRVGQEHGNTFAFGSRHINLSKEYGDALFTVHTRKCSVFQFLLWRTLNVG